MSAIAYETFKQQHEQQFNEWNEQQKEHKKIMIPCIFDVNFPKPKIETLLTKTINKKEGGTEEIKQGKIKGIKDDGSEVFFKIQSPSVISPSGLAVPTKKSKAGEVVDPNKKASTEPVILAIYDTRNPHHQHYLNERENMIFEIAKTIAKSPSEYGIQERAIKDDDPTLNPSWLTLYAAIKGKISAKVVLPKLADGTYDFDSPYRHIYYSPTFWKDPSDPASIPVVMRVKIYRKDGPPVDITPTELQMMCEGKTIGPDGKIIKGKKRGFEFSPEEYYKNIHVGGGKVAIKTLCTSLTVLRFFEAPQSDSQEGKVKYLQSQDNSDVNQGFEDLEQILSGLRSSSEIVTPIIKGSFDPMGGIDNNSLISSLNLKEAGVVSPAPTHQSLPQTEVVNSLPNPIQQLPSATLPPPIPMGLPSQSNIPIFSPIGGLVNNEFNSRVLTFQSQQPSSDRIQSL